MSAPTPPQHTDPVLHIEVFLEGPCTRTVRLPAAWRQWNERQRQDYIDGVKWRLLDKAASYRVHLPGDEGESG